MRTLLALLLAALAGSHETEFFGGTQRTGQCVAVFHRDFGFSGMTHVAALPGDGRCHRRDSRILSPSSRRGSPKAGSGHFWARGGCRLQVYTNDRSCRGTPWLDLEARIISMTQFATEIGGPAALLPGVTRRQKFGSARCTCGAAALARLPGVNDSALDLEDEEDDEEEAEASEEEEEEDADQEEEDDNDEEDMAQEGMAQEGDEDEGTEEEGSLSLLEEEHETTWGHRRRASAKREHRPCSYLFWRKEASWWSLPHWWGKVRRNKCVTFRSSWGADAFDSGYAITDNRCRFELYLGPGCTSHRAGFAPSSFTPFGARGTARLSPDLGGWTGEFKSVGCRCV